MSGQAQQKITVVSFNPDWAQQYEVEKLRLLNVLAPHIAAIEHTGSTSIPGQDAKPIIDIFAAVHPFQASSVYASLLSGMAYKFTETGMSGRYLFVKEMDGTRTHHLHLLPFEGFFQRNELLFRDYLRTHPELVREYGELKRNLAEQHTDAEAYTRAKTSFIQLVVDQAREEKGLPIQDVWDS